MTTATDATAEATAEATATATATDAFVRLDGSIIVPNLCDDAHGLVDATAEATATDAVYGIVGSIAPVDANGTDATQEGYVPFHFSIGAGMKKGLAWASRIAETEGKASEEAAWHSSTSTGPLATAGLLQYLGWKSPGTPKASTIEALPTLRALRALLSARTAAVVGTRIAVPAEAKKASKASKATVPAGTDAAVARAAARAAASYGKA